MPRDLPASARTRKPVIALLEDHAPDAELLRFALEQTGHDFDLVVLKTGEEAMHYLAGLDRPGAPRPCDLMFMDLNVPLLNGFEVLEHLRAHKELRKIPVIIFSGSCDGDDVNRCYAAGANSYVPKATNIDEILSKTASIIHYWFECCRLPEVDLKTSHK
jgi:CheY-like chemotaxis protein